MCPNVSHRHAFGDLRLRVWGIFRSRLAGSLGLKLGALKTAENRANARASLGIHQFVLNLAYNLVSCWFPSRCWHPNFRKPPLGTPPKINLSSPFEVLTTSTTRLITHPPNPKPTPVTSFPKGGKTKQPTQRTNHQHSKSNDKRTQQASKPSLTIHEDTTATKAKHNPTNNSE